MPCAHRDPVCYRQTRGSCSVPTAHSVGNAKSSRPALESYPKGSGTARYAESRCGVAERVVGNGAVSGRSVCLSRRRECRRLHPAFCPPRILGCALSRTRDCDALQSPDDSQLPELDRAFPCVPSVSGRIDTGGAGHQPIPHPSCGPRVRQRIDRKPGAGCAFVSFFAMCLGERLVISVALCVRANRFAFRWS